MQFVVYSTVCTVCSLFKAFRKLEWRDFTIEFSGAILGNCQRASCNWLCFSKALSEEANSQAE